MLAQHTLRVLPGVMLTALSPAWEADELFAAAAEPTDGGVFRAQFSGESGGVVSLRRAGQGAGAEFVAPGKGQPACCGYPCSGAAIRAGNSCPERATTKDLRHWQAPACVIVEVIRALDDPHGWQRHSTDTRLLLSQRYPKSGLA